MLLIGFAVMDGFDLGAGMLLPFVARTDSERRIVINTVGPVWEGNQVWLILGGGRHLRRLAAALCRAFSGFYLAMFLVLCALILRPVGFKFRSKMPEPRWRETWDLALFIGGLVPALIFGVAFGNVLRGVPFRFDDTLRLTYEGGLIGLLNPFALLCGLVSVAMLVMHGGAWLAVKAEEPVAGRARRTAFLASFAADPAFRPRRAVDGEAAWAIASPAPSSMTAPPIPWARRRRRRRAPGSPTTAPFPGPCWRRCSPCSARCWRRPSPAAAGATAWPGSPARFSVAGVVATAGVSMFPFILPSSLDPRSSLTVWDASSSQTTLGVMLIAAVIFVPIILAYTSFVYRVLRGRVTAAQIDADHESY